MQTIILGFDAFDPKVFERLSEKGSLPNLSHFVEKKGYSRFEVANPPQSEVSWTSIATGLDPGGHGIFDFVHRDPKSYVFYVSLLPTQKKMGAVQFVSPFSSRTIFEQASRRGYPATSLWWPATFPARLDLAVNTLPGLGTPDIMGKLGVGTFFTSEADFENEQWKTKIEILSSKGRDGFRGSLKGPMLKKTNEVTSALLPIEIERLDDQRARVTFDKTSVELTLGKWSPITELTFNISLLVKVRVITRFILTRLEPQINLYCLPLQIHPLHSPWPYGASPAFVKNTWNKNGPFLTIGWPQDTTSLEDGCISDNQFLDLCNLIFSTREEILMNQIGQFKEGLLASVFDSLDRIQHMFWRDRQDVVEQWYIKLDGLVGRVEDSLAKKGSKPQIVIVSDHGFNNFKHKVHLNRWLIEKGYLIPKQSADKGNFQDVDWTQTQAYGLGLNSLYMNLEGREGKGIVQKDRIEPLLKQLHDDLLSWIGPGGQPVLTRVAYRHEALTGPLVEFGPDLILGYSPGYRASAQTGLGGWEIASIEPNQDHWGADHCIDFQSVPGVLFSNQGLQNLPSPSFRDFPRLTIHEDLEGGGKYTAPSLSEEEQETLEERLKSLGYL